jgi:hypothetical protein
VRPDTTENLRQISQAHPEAFAAEDQAKLAHLAAFTLAMKEFSNIKKRGPDLLARMQLLTLELAGDRRSAARRVCAQAVAFAWAERWVLSTIARGAGVNNCRHSRLIRMRDAPHRRFMR